MPWPWTWTVGSSFAQRVLPHGAALLLRLDAEENLQARVRRVDVAHEARVGVADAERPEALAARVHDA
jgi:hypothetical protein